MFIIGILWKFYSELKKMNRRCRRMFMSLYFKIKIFIYRENIIKVIENNIRKKSNNIITIKNNSSI
jgi:hypothetical protein